jgi:hypothetical protein
MTISDLKRCDYRIICRSVFDLKSWPTIWTGQKFRNEKENQVMDIYEIDTGRMRTTGREGLGGF